MKKNFLTPEEKKDQFEHRQKTYSMISMNSLAKRTPMNMKTPLGFKNEGITLKIPPFETEKTIEEIKEKEKSPTATVTGGSKIATKTVLEKEEPVQESEEIDEEMIELENSLTKTRSSRGIFFSFIMNIFFIIVLIMEYRVSHIADISDMINSIFLNKIVDNGYSYVLSDTSIFNSPDIIYDLFVSKSLLKILYSENDDLAGDLSSIPAYFSQKSLDMTLENPHYLKYNNYYVGGSIYLSNFTLNDNDYSTLSDVYGYFVRDNIMKNLFDTNQTDYSETFPDDMLIRRYDNNNIEFLLLGDVDIDVAQYITKKAESYFKNSTFLNQIQTNIYLFNPIYEIYVQASFTYVKTLQGTMNFQSNIVGGFPLLYNSHQMDPNMLSLYFAIKIMFFVWILIMFLYEFLITIFLMVGRFMYNNPFELDLYVLTNILKNMFFMISISYLLSFYITYQKNQIDFIFRPLNSFDNLEFLKNFFVGTQNIFYLSIILIFVLLLETIIHINSLFPSFGIHLMTLSKAGSDLILLLIVMMMLLLSFGIWAHVYKGSSFNEFNNLGKCMLFLFQYMISGNYISFIKDSDVQTTIFYFLFYICYNLVLMIFFVAVILSSYMKLRTKAELTTEALAVISSKKTKNLWTKWMNLFFMKPPMDESMFKKEEEEEDKDKESRPSHSQKYFLEKQSKKKFTGTEIILYNLNKLDLNLRTIWTIFSQNMNEIQTREEKRKILDDEKAAIIDKRKADSDREDEYRKTNVFNYLKNTILHVIFLAIYITAYLYQMPITEVKDLQKEIYTFYNNSFCSKYNINRTSLDYCYEDHSDSSSLTYSDINFLPDVLDWVYGIYLPSIEDPLYLNKNSTGSLHVFDKGIDILGHYGSRATFRYYEVKSDEIPQPSIIVFPYYIHTLNYFNGESTLNGEFTGIFREFINGTDWKYNPPGNSKTSYGSGGFSVFFDKGNSTENNELLKDWMLINETFNSMTGLIAFDTIFYSEYYGCFASTKFEFIATSSGNTKKQIITHVFYLDFYGDKQDSTTEIILEILVLFFHIHYWIILWKAWWVEWIYFEDLTPYHDKLKLEKNKFLYIFDIDPNDCTDNEISTSDYFWLVLIRLFYFFLRFLYSIQNYLLHSVLNFIELCSQFTIFIAIIYWISLISNSDVKNFKIQDQIDSHDETLFSTMENLGLYIENYRKIQSISIFLILLQSCKYMYFSKRMSRLLDVFSKAKFDLLFFMSLFVIIFIAFTLMGYFTFGVEISDFNTFPKSIVKCLIILIGNVNLQELLDSDVIMGPIFYFTFMIAMNLILLKMFIAIIDGHYITQFNYNQQTSHLDFFGWMTITLRTETENLSEEIKKWKNKTPLPSKSTFRQKIKRILENYIYHYTFLKRHIFLLILGGHINPVDGTIIYEDLNSQEHNNIDTLKGTSTTNKFNFHFQRSQKRRLDEYDDLQIYITNRQNFVITTNDDKDVIEEVNFGLIDIENINPNQRTSMNVWMNMLNQNLVRLTNKKLDLGFLENQNYSFWFDLNSKFFINNKEFLDYQTVNFPRLSQNPFKALEEILQDASEDKRKHRGDIEIIKDTLEKMDFILFYFLYFYTCNANTEENDNDPIFKKSQAKHLNTLVQMPTLKTIATGNESPRKIDEMGESDGYNLASPRRKNKYPMIKLEFITAHTKKPLRFEELKKMDDNELIQLMCNFTGLLNIWNSLHANDRFFLWAGTDEKCCLQIYHKSIIWNQLNFKGANLRKSGLEKNFMLAKILKNDEITNEMMEYIWFFCYLDEKCQDDIALKKLTSTQEMRNQPIRKLSKYHLKIVETLLKKTNVIANLSQTTNINKRHEILKGEFSKSLKKDEKLFWWLLLDPLEKIKLIFASPSKMMAELMILMVIEEHYDNILTLTRMEKVMNTMLNHQLYMHSNAFARVESLTSSITLNNAKNGIEEDKDTFEFIKYLEQQVKRTNELLKAKLSEYQSNVEKVKDIKEKITRIKDQSINANENLIKTTNYFRMAIQEKNNSNNEKHSDEENFFKNDEETKN